MHILLTDILTCPRCGPQFGLILLADRIENRRVLEGRLGCANCREQYVVHHGAGHFGAEPAVPAGVAVQESAVRLAALMGLVQGSNHALVAGPAAAHAPALAALLPGIEVVAVSEPADGAPPVEATPGVSRFGVGARLPFANLRMAGVALTGTRADALLEEGARVLSPVGRLLVEPAPADAAERVQAAGLRVVAHEGSTLVAARA